MRIDEALRTLAQKPYDELVKIGRLTVKKAMPKVQQLLNDNKDATMSFLYYLIGSCIGIDNSLTTLEVQYLNDVLDFNQKPINYKDLAIKATDEKLIDTVDRVLDALDKETKNNLGCFCACLFAVDKNVGRNEVAFLSRLLA